MIEWDHYVGLSGAAVVGPAVEGETVVGSTVVGSAVEGERVVGAAVVGAAVVGAEITQNIRVRAVSVSVMLVYSVYQRCSSASLTYWSYWGLRGHRCYLGSRRYTELSQWE